MNDTRLALYLVNPLNQLYKLVLFWQLPDQKVVGKVPMYTTGLAEKDNVRLKCLAQDYKIIQFPGQGSNLDH